ncbi:LOW QUALITY PROTEIN: DDE_4 domain-containing protein [Cephalotus follicularis]|uniref:DDE_4 domain-containing protein n=1 Tax=Cephalotus follicularis TaxID=3775 RepID=A0A1Q3CBQ4_CEPFO|nr:LOW QUALITY PROTEIN: DDE_4 domain-containing protein [Cephalotus follicularis]
MYMNSLLCRGDIHCIDQIRMRPVAFYELCNILTRYNLGHHLSIKEQVLLFVHYLGHNVRFPVLAGWFHRSSETCHRYFRIVLKVVLKLYKYVVRSPDDSTPPEIMNSQRFYPYFKDCVGAIDGTHVRASVPSEIQGRFRGRKGGTTQNVLDVITFDLKFTYVLAGWEGSAHDSRILNSALSRSGGFKIPEGKFYLGDAGYGVRLGIISPYRGVRYHLNEFSKERPPEKEKELFNLHSSLRTTIECGFGILKKHFRVLDAEPFWSFATQVDVVLACCVIHNHIMGVDPSDPVVQEVNNEIRSRSERQTHREEREENMEWLAKRDNMASAMWDNYSIIRHF